MRGNYPYEYLNNTNIQKSMEEIWDDIDDFTMEIYPEDAENRKIDLFIPIPPLKYDGIFTKGLLMTQSAEYIIDKYPKIKDLFFVGAYSMCCAYSWCDKADIYFTCYENNEREKHHKKTHKNKKDIIFIPLQDADFTNENIIAPQYNTEKTIDLLSVSTPYQVKNHYMIAKAIKAYEKKYNTRLKTTFIFGLKEIKKDRRNCIDFSELSDSSKKIIAEVNEILDGRMQDYIDIVPHVHFTELAKYYSASKCLVLASLLEGKNRSINEAIACGTPFAVFKQLNQYPWGGFPDFYINSGEFAEEFTPEALADAIHKVITHPENYTPRKNYIKYNGRTNFVNTCVDYMPYYKNIIPDLEKRRFHDNVWVNLATQDNYQMCFHDYLYSDKQPACWVQNTKNIDLLIKYYYSLFGIK